MSRTLEAVTGRTPQSSETYRWDKQWRLDRAHGQKRNTGPERAQAHVQDLISRYGVSARSIAEVAGTAGQLISELNRGVCHGVKVATEQRILAVRPQDIFNRPNARGHVPAVGARRRLQALMVMGWRHQDLIPMLGFLTTNLNHQAGDLISQQKHNAMKDLYDRLWNVNGPASPASLGRIAKAGYAPPLAWDDDGIDDPNAAPDLGAKVYGQGRTTAGAIRRSDAIVEDTEFLLEDGCTWPEILTRLCIKEDALERLIQRAGRSDLTNRAKTMTERLALARTA